MEVVKLYSASPAEMKEAVHRCLTSRLPEESEDYWVAMTLLGLLNRDAFLATLRGGNDVALLRCLLYSPESAAAWPEGIALLQERWGKGAWDWRYEMAAWTSLSREDFRDWSHKERAILLDLVVRSLKSHRLLTAAIDTVVAKAFDVEAVAGKSLYEMPFMKVPLSPDSHARFAEWLLESREELLDSEPPPAEPEAQRTHTGFFPFGPGAPTGIFGDQPWEVDGE